MRGDTIKNGGPAPPTASTEAPFSVFNLDDDIQSATITPVSSPPKKRGRPRKSPLPGQSSFALDDDDDNDGAHSAKRCSLPPGAESPLAKKRGRPRKHPLPESPLPESPHSDSSLLGSTLSGRSSPVSPPPHPLARLVKRGPVRPRRKEVSLPAQSPVRSAAPTPHQCGEDLYEDFYMGDISPVPIPTAGIEWDDRLQERLEEPPSKRPRT